MPQVPTDTSIITILGRSPIFSILGAGELAGLASAGRRGVVQAGVDLFHAGDPGDTIQVILSGAVRIRRLTGDGHVLVLRRCGPGEVLGQMSAIDRSAHSVEATAVLRTEVLTIPARMFRALLEQRPALALRLAAVLAGRVRSLSEDLEAMKFGTIGQRVVRLLSVMAAGRREVRLTHQELADQVGSTRENVSRVLGLLRERGVLRTGRGIIEILDHAGLASDDI